ncbi:MAG: AMP-binding protein, partial [Polynucleobacter sp.]|nr:AMP-binding protein [Polynucleobacter sp.]
MSQTSSYKTVHQTSISDPIGFWGEQAKLIYWEKPFEEVLDYSNPPFSKWFKGGLTNLCYNAVDRHLAERGDQIALAAVSTEIEQERTYTFKELHAEVNRMAAILKDNGVTKGDRVLIYMPMIAEACFAMLACARIGAVHSVVFGGFASHSLAARIDDAQPKMIISADAGMRMGKGVPYKPLLDEAIVLAESKPAKVLIVNRGLTPYTPVAGRDLDFAAEREKHLNAQVPVEWVDATHPSYILY